MMTRRLKVILGVGVAAVIGAAVTLVEIVDRSRPDFSPTYATGWAPGPTPKGPPVLMWFDAPHERMADDCIRIDVREGMPFTRVNPEPIADVAAHVRREQEGKRPTWVIVTASRKEKLGDVMAVVEACRQTPVRGIVLNFFLEAWDEPVRSRRD